MNNLQAPLVSIVTPMHNEAQHLVECIESVIRQTYTNWEYIIVDNCSTDQSLKIARNYAASDHRIRVVENDRFLNAIPNHNAALRQIAPVSKYCKVVFADDWIFPECIEQMVSLAEVHPSVGLVGAYGLEGQEVVWTGLPYPSTVVPGATVCRRLFQDGLYVFGTATSVLYRADLVRSRDQFFDVDDVHSDMDVCIALLKQSDFGFVHQVLTFTRVREGSRITTSRNINTLAASKLKHLTRHGPCFLDAQEFTSCLSKSISEYYEYLGNSFLRGRDKYFWEFHKDAFHKASVHFSRAKLLKAILKNLVLASLNLENSIKKLRNARSRSRPASERDKTVYQEESSEENTAQSRPGQCANGGPQQRYTS
jgi:glycosyltransferase involved in cell wall biosynthesis